jgi:hypothetical protein
MLKHFNIDIIVGKYGPNGLIIDSFRLIDYQYHNRLVASEAHFD